VFRRSSDPYLAWFESEVAAHQHRLYGFARYQLRDEEEARDVVQETLLRLWTNRSKIDRAMSTAWLTRVCRNACIDRLRKRRTRQPADLPIDDVFADDATPADVMLHDGDMRERVLALLEDLAEPYRSLVILRDIQDLSYDEIASAMDLPLNTVKVYLHRARKRLRTRLLDDVRHEC
jgi:RNA polymerase sigma factor (sigma-70 family)